MCNERKERTRSVLTAFDLQREHEAVIEQIREFAEAH
jgi:hypothetical protein